MEYAKRIAQAEKVNLFVVELGALLHDIADSKFNPHIKPNLAMSKDEYKRNEAPTLNHFYEKLLLLKDRTNTETGKRIAKSQVKA